jgi:hypothetical protein
MGNFDKYAAGLCERIATQIDHTDGKIKDASEVFASIAEQGGGSKAQISHFDGRMDRIISNQQTNICRGQLDYEPNRP